MRAKYSKSSKRERVTYSKSSKRERNDFLKIQHEQKFVSMMMNKRERERDEGWMDGLEVGWGEIKCMVMLYMITIDRETNSG